MSFTRLEGLGLSRQHAANVTVSDTVDLPNPGLGFISDKTGVAVVTTTGGEKVTVPTAAGVPVYLAVSRIWSTGTTAAATIVVFW